MSNLETLISRYAIGEPLSGAEREQVERELERGAEANEMLATEHRLTELLRMANPLPAIDYDKLAQRISANIPQSPMIAAKTAGASADAMENPDRRAIFSWPKLALAASVLIAAGVAVPLLTRDGETTSGVGGLSSPSPTNIAVVTVRAVDGGTPIAATSGGVSTVTVGPSRALAERPGTVGNANAATSRPSNVSISGDGGGSDNPLAPR